MSTETEIVKTSDNLPVNLNKAQLAFITQKTPQEHVYFREGSRGMKFAYVKVGYVVNVLNQAFGWNWDFEIVTEQVGKKQVWVRGLLTVRVGNNVIKKGGYGGSDIKFYANTETPIDIANDLKAAGSDCLKKCASLLGIAGDIYYPGENLEE